MPREKPIPVRESLDHGVTVTLYQSRSGWAILVHPVGRNAQEKLRPRWTANYMVSRKAVSKDATMRDGCLTLAEELCLALDGWLELAIVEAP